MIGLLRNSNNCALSLTEYDECASRPCINSDQCIDKINDYECKCRTGYTGKNCEIGKLYSSIKIAVLISIEVEKIRSCLYHEKSRVNSKYHEAISGARKGGK